MTSVDRLEQRGLLAEQVVVGTGDHAHVDPVAPSRRGDLRDGLGDAIDVACHRAAHAEDDLARADRARGNERAFDHPVRVGTQDRAVLERAGLALGRVHHHARRTGGGLVGDDRLPLAHRGESRAAVPTQAGVADQGDDRLGRQIARGAQCVAAAFAGGVIERGTRGGGQSARDRVPGHAQRPSWARIQSTNSSTSPPPFSAT